MNLKHLLLPLGLLGFAFCVIWILVNPFQAVWTFIAAPILAIFVIILFHFLHSEVKDWHSEKFPKSPKNRLKKFLSLLKQNRPSNLDAYEVNFIRDGVGLYLQYGDYFLLNLPKCVWHQPYASGGVCVRLMDNQGSLYLYFNPKGHLEEVREDPKGMQRQPPDARYQAGSTVEHDEAESTVAQQILQEINRIRDT